MSFFKSPKRDFLILMTKFSSIPKAISALKNGKMLIIVDDPSRENQGDIFFPAQTATTENINFLISECRGLVCAPVSYEYAERLNLPLMLPLSANSESTCVNFTLSVDAKNVSDYGISAADRSLTLRQLANPQSKSSDFVRPGHIFPLIANDDGVIGRPGHTEAAVELCKLAGFNPCGVICEILNNKGAPARMPGLIKMAEKYDLPIITIADLIIHQKEQSYRPKKSQSIWTQTANASLPTEYGDFKISVYASLMDSQEHTLLTAGDIKQGPVLTRIHSKCFTGDTLLSKRCDCHAQLELSMRLIQQKGSGAIVYLDQEGRSIGFSNKIKAYALQEQGMDTVEANEALGFLPDERDYQVAAEILKDAGIKSIDLLTNNLDKQIQLEAYGVHIAERIPLETVPNIINKPYLAIKKKRMGHQLSEV